VTKKNETIEYDNTYESVPEIIIDKNNKLTIDGEKINFNQIYDALYATCGGTTEKVKIKFHNSVPMSILDSVENELLKLNILRVSYYKY